MLVYRDYGLQSTLAPMPSMAATVSSFGSARVDSSDPKPGGPGIFDSEDLSFTIGIICAVSGNILISFALNIQRYSHLRIEREAQQCHRKCARTPRRVQQQQTATTTRTPTVQVNGAIHTPDYEESQFDQDRSPGNDAVRFPPIDDDLCYGSRNGDPDIAYSQSESVRHSEETELLPKKTVPDDKESDLTERQSYLSSPYWWAGIILMTVGEIGNFVAYGFAPASVVSPLGVVSLMANCLIAPCLLNEAFRYRDFWGVLVAIAGTVAVVSSTEGFPSHTLGADEVLAAVTSLAFEIYLCVTFSLIVLLAFLSEGQYSESIFVDIGLVGLFGGYTALSTKGISSILSSSGWHVLTYPITYPLLFVLLFTAMLQVRYINRALQKFGSTQVIPTQFVLFTISVIVGSAVLYGDFSSATPSQTAAFIGGCSLTFFGVHLLTTGRLPESQVEDIIDEEEPASVIPGVYDEHRNWAVPIRAEREGANPQPTKPISHEILAETAGNVQNYQHLRPLQHKISSLSSVSRSSYLNTPPSQASSVHRSSYIPYAVEEEPSTGPSSFIGSSASSIHSAEHETQPQLPPAAPMSHAATSASPAATLPPPPERPQQPLSPTQRVPRLSVSRRSVDNFGSFAPLGPLSTSLTALVADQAGQASDLDEETAKPAPKPFFPKPRSLKRRQTYQTAGSSPVAPLRRRHTLSARAGIGSAPESPTVGDALDRTPTPTPSAKSASPVASALASPQMSPQIKNQREKFFDRMRQFSNSLTRNIGKTSR